MECFYQLREHNQPLYKYITSYGAPDAGERNFRNVYIASRTTHPKQSPIMDVFDEVQNIDAGILYTKNCSPCIIAHYTRGTQLSGDHCYAQVLGGALRRSTAVTHI